jgi:hypothetical protein
MSPFFWKLWRAAAISFCDWRRNVCSSVHTEDLSLVYPVRCDGSALGALHGKSFRAAYKILCDRRQQIIARELAELFFLFCRRL